MRKCGVRYVCNLQNTLYIERAGSALRKSGIPAPDSLLAHASPLGWRHVSLTDDYHRNDLERGLGPDGYRKLNPLSDYSRLDA
jgi:hypothetical protein